MFELLALVGAVVVGILLLKFAFAVLGVLFHLLLLPLKLLGAVVVTLVALPFVILLLPVFLVMGLGFAAVGVVCCGIFGFFCAF